MSSEWRMTESMIDREDAIRNLAIGDIFHAHAPNGASLVCLVTSLSESRICARRIPTQEDLEFDRRTGVEIGPIRSRIDSVAPLPEDIYQIFVAMDRKNAEICRDVRLGIRLEDIPERSKLNGDERRALLFLHSHYASNRLQQSDGAGPPEHADTQDDDVSRILVHFLISKN